MPWQDILRSTLSKETINASNLRRIPHLTDCPFWDRAVFLGRLSYRTRVAYYDGGLVRYDDRVYYVNRSQIEALRKYLRWNLRKSIRVIEDQDTTS